MTNENARTIVTAPPAETYDWDAIVNGLNQYLRLRSIPIGMKLFETVEAMEAIPKIRRPRVKHTTDQVVAQARQLGWTVGITMADLVGAQQDLAEALAKTELRTHWACKSPRQTRGRARLPTILQPPEGPHDLGRVPPL
jgi:hypothetical protein